MHEDHREFYVVFFGSGEYGEHSRWLLFEDSIERAHEDLRDIFKHDVLASRRRRVEEA